MQIKRIIAAAALTACLAAPARAEIDLEGMSLADLVRLRDQITAAMWASDEWQEVTVPPGVYQVGVDIPAGHWTLKCAEGSTYNWASVEYCRELDETGKKSTGKSWYTQIKVEGSEASVEAVETDIDAKEGFYIIIEYGSVIFTPYAARDLGFK